MLTQRLGTRGAVFIVKSGPGHSRPLGRQFPQKIKAGRGGGGGVRGPGDHHFLQGTNAVEISNSVLSPNTATFMHAFPSVHTPFPFLPLLPSRSSPPLTHPKATTRNGSPFLVASSTRACTPWLNNHRSGARTLLLQRWAMLAVERAENQEKANSKACGDRISLERVSTRVGSFITGSVVGPAELSILFFTYFNITARLELDSGHFFH